MQGLGGQQKGHTSPCGMKQRHEKGPPHQQEREVRESSDCISTVVQSSFHCMEACDSNIKPVKCIPSATLKDYLFKALHLHSSASWNKIVTNYHIFNF